MNIELEEMDIDKFLARVKVMMEEIPYITLSTIDENGNPWVSPLNSAYDEDFNFYFKSPLETEHSDYFKKKKKASWVLFDATAEVGTGLGIYFKGEVIELNEENIEDIKKGNELIAKRVGKICSLVTKFLKMSPRRVYKCIPKEIY